MRAVRFGGDGRVTVERVPRPEPGPGELLVDVAWCALCGSDREAYRRGSAVTPGHEVAGRVAALGPGVPGPPLGTPGVVYLVDPCGSCYACVRGSTNTCLARRRMYGFTTDGGLAEAMVVSAGCFRPVAPELPLDVATALLDVAGTSVHALERGGLVPQARVTVIGCGPIGLGVVASARALGARTVYALDVAPVRLELARSLGAVAFDAGTDGEARVRAHAPDGCELVVEAAGLPATQAQALRLVAPGGRVVVVAHSGTTLELHPSRDLIAREVSLIGSEYFPLGDLPRLQALVRSGRLDPAPILTDRLPLDRAAEAFRRFWSGATGKVLVHP
jgi:threonine dehydrogenase-like Zn-dependent dehydrogenase